MRIRIRIRIRGLRVCRRYPGRSAEQTTWSKKFHSPPTWLSVPRPGSIYDPHAPRFALWDLLWYMYRRAIVVQIRPSHFVSLAARPLILLYLIVLHF
jgi:hypothetical protein